MTYPVDAANRRCASPNGAHDARGQPRKVRRSGVKICNGPGDGDKWIKRAPRGYGCQRSALEPHLTLAPGQLFLPFVAGYLCRSRGRSVSSQINHNALAYARITSWTRRLTMDAIYVVILLSLFAATLGLVVAIEHIGDET